MTGTKPRLLVVCHDAGGAEIVSSWVCRHLDEFDQGSISFVLQGPAQMIFSKVNRVGLSLGWRDEIPSLGEIDFILCGSSKTALLEQAAVREARIRGIRCAVYLDHWTNYRERFGINPLYPDEVWVADNYAYQLAHDALPGADVVLKGNPYLEDVVAEIASHSVVPNGREHVLYVREPAREREERSWLLQERGFSCPVEDYARREIRVRLHPSEKSLWRRTLAEDIAWADTVVGCDTMALVVALKAGRRVISLLPASESHLPFPEIERPLG